MAEQYLHCKVNGNGAFLVRKRRKTAVRKSIRIRIGQRKLDSMEGVESYCLSIKIWNSAEDSWNIMHYKLFEDSGEDHGSKCCWFADFEHKLR